MGLRILFICTGNVCRSPAAEILLRSRLDAQAQVSVASAGVGALVGEGVDQPTAAVLAGLGVDPTRHRARQFEPWMAADAHLVLTAERSQRDIVMRDFPPAHRRTFTMREFARLALLDQSRDPASLIAELSAQRGALGAVDEADDDIPDPYRAGLIRAHDAVLQVAETVEVTLAALGLTPARPRPQPGARRPHPAPRSHAAPRSQPAPRSRPAPGRR